LKEAKKAKREEVKRQRAIEEEERKRQVWRWW